MFHGGSRNVNTPIPLREITLDEKNIVEYMENSATCSILSLTALSGQSGSQGGKWSQGLLDINVFKPWRNHWIDSLGTCSGQLKAIDGWTDIQFFWGPYGKRAFRGSLQLHKDLCALAWDTKGPATEANAMNHTSPHTYIVCVYLWAQKQTGFTHTTSRGRAIYLSRPQAQTNSQCHHPSKMDVEIIASWL